MNLFSFLVLIVSIGLFLIAFHLYKEYYRNIFHIIYTRLFMVCGLFVFVLFLIANANSREEVFLWMRFLAISHFIFPLITDSLLHLFRDKIHINKNLKNALLYIPFIILFILDVVNPSLTFDEPRLTRWGWVYVNRSDFSLFFFYKLIYYLNVLFLIFLIIHFYIAEKDPDKRRFLVFFVITLLLPFALFLILTYLFHKGIDFIIPFTAIAGVISFLLMFIFLRRFSVFDISLQIALNDITSNMTNMLFLLDKETRIVEVNHHTCRVLSYMPTELVNMPFNELVFSEKPVDMPVNQIMVDSEVYLKSKENRYIPAFISISKVFRRKVFLGYMVMGNDLSKIHQLTGEKKMLQLELKALQAQMNPHFIFNALNSILVLISRRDEVKANEYITCLSNLIRRVMENVNKELVTIDEEIELLHSYVAIEALRFEEGFQYSIEKKGSSKNGVPLIPPMIIQPFVENAIWHGLLPMDSNKDKILGIHFEKKKNQLEVVIADNGVGRARAQLIDQAKHKVHRSQGIRNIEERIRLYNSFSDTLFIDLHIEDLEDENRQPGGTEVRIHFDLLKQKQL
jgi:PAS domain S-box-containing protein